MGKVECPLFRAFTLVETVAFGSLMLAVLALLVPSMRAARQRGQLTNCLDNLRAIGQASVSYAADDPDELLIPIPDWGVLPAMIGGVEWGGKAGVGQGAKRGLSTFPARRRGHEAHSRVVERGRERARRRRKS